MPDVLVIGGGIAGLSAAAALVPHGRVVVLEAEDALGVHASGRSATFAHYGIGDAVVRGLTAWSRRAFLTTGGETPVASEAGALFIAREAMLPALHALGAEMGRYSDRIAAVGPAEMVRLCPILKVGPGAAVAGLFDPDGLKLDADTLLQHQARRVRSGGGEVRTGERVVSIARAGSDWEVTTPSGRFSAPVLVNAAGAWADRIAVLAGVRPLGLAALRRTIIVVDPPAGVNARGWPFVKTAADEFYMLTDGGRLLASPVDEVPDEPGDAAPEEYDVALAAWRLEEYTTVKVDRVAHRWAGLRTFTADRVPTAGFAPDAPGFFWLAGQGGYGLQTAPAMAAIAASLITGSAWPAGLDALGVRPDALRPERLVA